MGHACTHDQFPPPPKEHPVVAVLAVLAILAAIALIAWVRIEVHGLHDVEAALTEPVMEDSVPPVHGPQVLTHEERKVDAAVTSGRFATGFSP